METADADGPHLTHWHKAFRAIIAANWRAHEAERLYVESCRPAMARILAEGDAGLLFLQVWHYCVLDGDLSKQAHWHFLAVHYSNRPR
jgi:hypothetical protein